MGFLTRVLQHRPSPERRASFGFQALEDPSVPLSAFSVAGGRRTASGLAMTSDRALEIAAFYRGVNLIARTVGKLPLKVYERDGSGKTEAKTHPAYRLLRHDPSEFYGSFTFRSVLTVHAILHGNGYAAIERDAANRPTGLLILDPSHGSTFPVRRDGVLWYVSGFGTRHQARLPAADVLHIKGFGFDGLIGHSVVRYAAESLGLTSAQEGFSAYYFRNAATPRVVLEHPGIMGEEAARTLANQFDRLHSGIENSHRTAVLEEGMKANTLSLSARDSQLIEARGFQIREVALWLGLPPHKVGDPTRTSFASLEQENQAFLDDAIDPWLVAWEEEARAKLLTDRQKGADSHLVEHVRAALLRADLSARASFYQSAVLTGYMSRDEVRSRENLNPIPGGEGEAYFIPLNVSLTTDGQADEPPEVDADAESMRATLARLLADAAELEGRRIGRRLSRALDRSRRRGMQPCPVDLQAAHGEAIAAALEVPAAIAGAMGRGVDVDALAAELIEAVGRMIGDLEEQVRAWVADRIVGPEED